MSENWKNGNNQDPKTAQTVHMEKTRIWAYGAERRGKPSVATYCVIAAADRGTEGGVEEETEPHPNVPGSDLKRWSVARGRYRSRPSGLCRSYTALAPKLDLPFVGLEVVEAL